MSDPENKPHPAIDTDIPPPERQAKNAGRAVTEAYKPLRLLGVGHSVFITGKSLKTVETYLNGKVMRPFKQQGQKFVAEERTEDGVLGVRVWRTK